MELTSPDKLHALLDRRNEHPEKAREIDHEITKTFLVRRAIYLSDMSGFSKIVRQHGIIHFLAVIQQMRRITLPIIEANHGALVKTEADNVLAVFDCVEDALRTARAVRQQTADLNTRVPQDRQLHLSIGIGWGDILLMDYHDMYGDEVNIASKLGEDIAERDEMLMSDAAYQALTPGYARCDERQMDISGVKQRYWKVLA